MSCTDSQEAKILRWLKAGRSITSLLAFRKFRSLRLGARIYGLRRRGYDIQRRMVRRGEARVAEYRLAH